MGVRAELDGHPFDLDTLARHFPTGDPHIVVTDESAFLEATALDDMLHDTGRLVDTANEHLARLNGWVVLADAEYQPVRLRNRFVRDGGPTHMHIVVGDEARARDNLTVVAVGTAETRLGALNVTAAVDGVPVEPPPPEGPGRLARASLGQKRGRPSRPRRQGRVPLVDRAVQRCSRSSATRSAEVGRTCTTRAGRPSLS